MSPSQKRSQLSFFFIWVLLVAFPVLQKVQCQDFSRHLIDSAVSLNVLDYSGTPASKDDRRPLAFSDQGAWFAYGFPDTPDYQAGFTGPYIMTEGNGVWCSPMLGQLNLKNEENENWLNWNDFSVRQTAKLSHLEQLYQGEELIVNQKLFYSSEQTALIITDIVNTSDKEISLTISFSGELYLQSLHLSSQGKKLLLRSEQSVALGHIQLLFEKDYDLMYTDSSYKMLVEHIQLAPSENKEFIMANSFVFPDANRNSNPVTLAASPEEVKRVFDLRKDEKEALLTKLQGQMDEEWQLPAHISLLAKTVLTMQNNWRSAAGALNYPGLFPSYHYEWFHGFWAWDSWKHAVALSFYDIELAKDQVRAMYDFQESNGFIPDCVYRDTTIEAHNYRNTKPPLSAWAVWTIFQQDRDMEFIKEMYPMILKQHDWWYSHRDYDADGICEYGSTDASLIAAKWESGMDNAVRFDNSRILNNFTSAFSLDQESVDLNAYLYAEKRYLSHMAKSLSDQAMVQRLEKESRQLKLMIQNQFYDPGTGWFYDTNINGDSLIMDMGCEGWIPLWAKVASREQSIEVMRNMMDHNKFNTYMPLQTLAADHPKFKPNRGYWRGPVWLDQSYFGIRGLKNYGYTKEANLLSNKLMQHASGLMEKGVSIRENYQPITGEGMESRNFSWSAAHYLLLLIDK